MKRCKLLLNSIKKKAAQHLRFFPDEKISTVDEKSNRRNSRRIARSPEEVPPIMKTKHAAGIHVLSVISSHGHVMPPRFFKPKERMNEEVHLDTLQTVVKP